MAKKFKEKNFQSKLIHDLKAGGCRVKKMQSGMGYTVVDIYFRHPERGAFWCELKTLDSVNQKVPLTELQRADLIDEIRHGGHAACLVAVKANNGVDEYLFNLNLGEDYVNEQEPIDIRKRGGQWDIRRITHSVATENKGFDLR